MGKVIINPNRLQWCINTSKIDILSLSNNVNISMTTLEKAMAGQAVLSVKQLEKLANFFKRSLLFFLESGEVQEQKIYSPQFRNINNQKPIHSPKLRTFIERIEKQRQIYLGLMEDLDEPVNYSWLPDFALNTDNIKQASCRVRKWLNLPDIANFNVLRQAIENKGIMVFVFNDYNKQWQIDKNESIYGLSLFYDIFPIIAIKKQVNEDTQSFTLIHELAHLLLHKESVIDSKEDFYSYQGKEKNVNEFTNNLLVPDEFLSQINIEELLNKEITEYDHYLRNYKKNWCVNTEIILIRLLKNKKIARHHYQVYKQFKNVQKENKQIKLPNKKPISQKYQYKEIIDMFGKPFIYAIFDSLRNQKITLSKASTYLDNIKINDIHQLEQYTHKFFK